MYRILSVEDDPLMRNILKACFLAAGNEVFFCSNGTEALPMARQYKPDLVLLDVNLPDITGHQVCSALKSDAATYHIPVIMLTGEVREVEKRVGGLEAGADDYLFKPISPRLLIARVESILKQLGRH